MNSLIRWFPCLEAGIGISLPLLPIFIPRRVEMQISQQTLCLYGHSLCEFALDQPPRIQVRAIFCRMGKVPSAFPAYFWALLAPMLPPTNRALYWQWAVLTMMQPKVGVITTLTRGSVAISIIVPELVFGSNGRFPKYLSWRRQTISRPRNALLTGYFSINDHLVIPLRISRTKS